MASLLDGYFGKLMSKLENKALATFLANFTAVAQEWAAVTFQLVCLSRLETTADIKSLLVLFLTLVVFTGPYLNAWLLFADYIFFKDWSSDIEAWFEGYKIVENIVLGVLIIGFHVLGSYTAMKIVTDWQPKSIATIQWNITATTMQPDRVLEVHFLEEMFAVTSLLIGWMYILWLRKIRKAETETQKGTPKMEIELYLQLVLLVAAVSQAFPDAQLSPHVGFYKVFMGRISHSVLMARLGGGAVGLLLSCIWSFARVNYRNGVQHALSADEDHHLPEPIYDQLGAVADADQRKTPRTALQRMPGIRLSMHGGSYF